MREQIRRRDDFSEKTKTKLRIRVSGICSRPGCNTLTIGADSTEKGFISIGVAAHIKAASPNGKRYDSSMTPEERKAPSNGIWLCQNDSKIIDSDESHYTVELLHGWKKQAEERSFAAVSRGPRKALEHPKAEPDDTQATFDLVIASCKTDAHSFHRSIWWPLHPILLNLKLVNDDSARTMTASSLASCFEVFDELAIIASPGTGKTTTLLQIVDSILELGLIAPIFVPLSEWVIERDSLFHSILKRHSFSNLEEGQLKILAEGGKLGLILDGWNELSDTSKKLVRNEIRTLRREFPELRLVISSRTGDVDFPTSGPTIEIDGLTEAQQLEISKTIRGEDGEKIIEYAQRTPGLRDLVKIPLYLTALLRHKSGAPLPQTKEEVLRLFVESSEQDPEKRVSLHEVLQDLHRHYLVAIAVEATRLRTTVLTESQVRAVVNLVQEQLKTENQIAQLLQPKNIVEVLINCHLLVRSSSNSLSFQHQQFQEWFTSFHVEQLMICEAQNAASRKTLRETVLDILFWQEPVLFACERLSNANHEGRKSVVSTVIGTLGIDPMLSAEMIFRSSNDAWVQMKDTIISFAKKWHSPLNADRAFRFMVLTGKREFAEFIWPLISSSDTQVQLIAFRAVYPFRTGVLGEDIKNIFLALPEDVRENFVSEVAINGRIDGIELATLLALIDQSVKVQTSAIEALIFCRADRLAAQIINRAPDQVWRELARKYHSTDFTDHTIAARIEKEALKIHVETTDPIHALRPLLNSNTRENGKDKLVQELVERIDFLEKQHNADEILYRIYQLYPDAVAAAMLANLVKGKAVPYLAEKILAASNIVVDSGPITEQGLKIKNSIVPTILGPNTVRLLIDKTFYFFKKMNANGKFDQVLSDQYQDLLSKIAKTKVNSFADALLSRSSTKDPEEIVVLAKLLSYHSHKESDQLIKFSVDERKAVVNSVNHWAETLLSSPKATRGDFAVIAMAAERLGSPELVPTLLELLSEDLKQWEKAKEELQKGKERKKHRDDANTSWVEQYKRAFIAIGDENTVNAMKPLLRNSEFGCEAALVLKSIWQKSQPMNELNGFSLSPDFSAVRETYEKRQGLGDKESHPFVVEILKNVTELIKAGSSKQENLLAIRLATVALRMPYAGYETVIAELLHLPVSYSEKSKFLTTLALSGQVLSSEIVLKGIDELLEDAKSKPWMMEQNGWRLKEWLKLLAFTEKPSTILGVLRSIETFDSSPWNLREILLALTYSPSLEAETVLDELEKMDKRMLYEYEWSIALLRRKTLTAAKIFLRRLCADFEGGEKSVPDKVLSTLIESHNHFRKEVYDQFEKLDDSPARSLIEHSIASVPDIEGILLLLRNAAKGKRRFESTYIGWAVRQYLIGPSSTERKVNEAQASSLRRQLFTLVLGKAVEVSQLAKISLVFVDEILDEYGPLKMERRHPDISSETPWPQV